MAGVVVLGLGVLPHLFKRMVDRSFNETDLRLMLENATGYHENHEVGRWAIETMHDRRWWEIIIDPIPEEQLLVILTAYPVE